MGVVIGEACATWLCSHTFSLGSMALT